MNQISDAARTVIAAQSQAARVAVVIPSYRVIGTIADVIRGIGPEVERIYVVDDGCPDRSGAAFRTRCCRRRCHHSIARPSMRR